jgi:7-cyano-7-deazaguanine synthase in queuosine biosynthesis
LRPTRNIADALHLDVNAPPGSSNRVNLRLEDLSRPLADVIPDQLVDLLEIAAYVYCADQFTSRGTNLMTDMGVRWRRRFHFRIPVRCSHVWRQPEVGMVLRDTLNFLSEDEFEFDFAEAKDSLPFQSYLDFGDPSAQVISPDEVILFSGGLDSLAGTVDALIRRQKKVILVSHQGSKLIASKQNALVSALRDRTTKGSLFHIPTVINKGQEEATEFTQRTRSLMFASLGLIVARMFGRNALSFYENGVVSINLPIAEHVLGSRASRTTHPRVLSDFGKLFSVLLDEQFTVENPYLWKTKSDVVRIIAESNCSDLVSSTLSCTRVREATKTGLHCGVCSQCIDRRFGVLGAGMAAHEPADSYAVDLFTGAHDAGPDLTMIESYVARAQKLGTMSEQGFLASYGQIFRLLSHLEGPADENARRVWDLHRRHGMEITSAVNAAMKEHASIAHALTLPPSSLLSMIASPVAQQPRYVDSIEAEPTAAAQAADDKHDYNVPQIVLELNTVEEKVIFRGGIEFGGSIYSLVAALAQEVEKDLAAGTPTAQRRFVEGWRLADRLKVEEPIMRRRVARARRKIETAFRETHHLSLERDDVIQNVDRQGYRLSPYVLLLKPGQIRDLPSGMSQTTGLDVTHRRPGP